MTRFMRFGVTGGIGFVCDAGLLWLLLRLTPLGPFSARLVSIAFAMTVTWLINRTVTFAPSGRGAIEEGARYAGVAVAVAGANYLVYAALLLAFPALPPVSAAVAASGAAMVLSYLGYSRLVFDR